MQDLTTGSITRHLLKTSGFMLVTMVFQTLYFLVDLYWVGRLGKEAVAAVAIAGNLTFIVLAISQMLGVGTTTLVSHAAGRKDHDAGAARVQPVAGALHPGRRDLSGGRDAAARRLRVDARCRLADGAAGRGVPDVVHSRHGAAVRDGGDGRGAPRHGQLQARDDRGDHDGHSQHGPRAISHLRMGDRRAARCGGRGDVVARRRRGWRGLARPLFHQAERVPALRPVAVGPAAFRSGARC